MAIRSPKQLEGDIRLVVVAAIAKEFRKSAIIARVISNIKSQGMVVRGGLANPKKSKSLIPTSDDRWLVNKDSVRVSVVTNSKGVVRDIFVRLNIEYGVNPKSDYYYLAEGTKRKKWSPNGNRIKKWVQDRMAKGDSFYTYDSKGKKKRATSKDIKKISYLIARSLKKKGLRKRSFANPFEYKRNGVEATLRKAKRNYEGRIYEKYLIYSSSIIEAEIIRI
jgi:hypothetical protein